MWQTSWIIAKKKACLHQNGCQNAYPPVFADSGFSSVQVTRSFGNQGGICRSISRESGTGMIRAQPQLYSMPVHGAGEPHGTIPAIHGIRKNWIVYDQRAAHTAMPNKAYLDPANCSTGARYVSLSFSLATQMRTAHVPSNSYEVESVRF